MAGIRRRVFGNSGQDQLSQRADSAAVGVHMELIVIGAGGAPGTRGSPQSPGAVHFCEPAYKGGFQGPLCDQGIEQMVPRQAKLNRC